MFLGTDQPSTIQMSQHCCHFEFTEILTATENFDASLVIGSGGFGKVYKGDIINGSSLVVVAIKRLDPMSNQGATEFWAEVKMLSMLQHCNIVSLIGYCIHEQEKILVYEYVPNGTLDAHLHKLHTPISWLRRLKICIDAGCGLRYLHNETGMDYGVIHRDVKSSNILLQESWAAKISDFGLSKTCPTNQPSTYVETRVKGSFGYIDPSYYQTGMLTRKSDVYAFGVVLLEMLCRKRAVDKTLGEDQWGLVPWAQDCIKEGKLKQIIDPDIRDQISSKCLKEFVRLANRCLHNNPKQRPTMVEVMASFDNIMNLQQRFNSSLRPTGSRTLFDRMVDMLPFPSNGDHPVQGDSSNIKGNNMLPELKEASVDCQSLRQSVNEFKLSDLVKATRKFSPDLLLGSGDLGEVFLGWVEPNTLAPPRKGVRIAVAVKRLNKNSSRRPADWIAEVNLLRQLDHPNIIRLLGCCSHSHEYEHLLVYEYMPNKSLDRLLFANASNIAEQHSWGTRLLIMIGVARGLTYLHLTKHITHGDLKTTNILLDEDFNAKLAGFVEQNVPVLWETGVSTRVLGNCGYAAPEYYFNGRLTTENDIYGLGVVLLESITGQRAFDNNRPEAQKQLVHWASLLKSNRRTLKKIIDPCLKHKYPLKGTSEYFTLALRCVAKRPKDRPSSKEVLQSLEQIYAQSLQLMEGKPDTV